MNNKVIIGVILILFICMCVLTTHEPVEQLYNDNAYIVLSSEEGEQYLLLNKYKEAMLEAEDRTEVYLSNNKCYVFGTDGTIEETVKVNKIQMLSDALQERNVLIERESDKEYVITLTRTQANRLGGYSAYLIDPTIVKLCYRVVYDTDTVFSCFFFTIDSDDTRIMRWSFRGYQSLFDWKLDKDWYSVQTDEERLTLLDTELSKIAKNVLTLFSEVGDDEVDWNVYGDAYIALDDQAKSVNVDKALLYMQNYGLGFIGNKEQLTEEINKFYSTDDNMKYPLYTVVQYVCSTNDWLLTGVDFDKPEEVVESVHEETEVVTGD